MDIYFFFPLASLSRFAPSPLICKSEYRFPDSCSSLPVAESHDTRFATAPCRSPNHLQSHSRLLVKTASPCRSLNHDLPPSRNRTNRLRSNAPSASRLEGAPLPHRSVLISFGAGGTTPVAANVMRLPAGRRIAEHVSAPGSP